MIILLAKKMICAFGGALSLLGVYAVVWLVSITSLIFESLNVSFPRAGIFRLGVDNALGLFLLAPLILFIAMGVWVFLSLRRWSGKGGWIRYQPLDSPRISVALTAFNDQESIFSAVKDFASFPEVIEVVVVDNNSTDRTTEIAKKAGANVVREHQQGYGFACIRGLRECLSNPQANIVVLCEGDGTFAGYDIKKLVPYLDNADMALGTRTTQELLDSDSQLGYLYIWGNLFLAKLIQIKFWDVKHWGRVRLTDVGCTYRAVRREALSKIVDDLRVGGHHFSPHMMMVALESGLRVIEVPVTFRKRVGKSKGAGGSKIKGITIGLRMLWSILTF